MTHDSVSYSAVSRYGLKKTDTWTPRERHLAASRWAAKTQAADRVEVAELAAADVRRQIASAAAQAPL